MLDPRQPLPVQYQPTWGALSRLRMPTPDHVAFYGSAMDLSCFLAAVGFCAADGIEKVGEIVGDLEGIVLRHDGTAIMLVWDGETIALHVGASADDPKLLAFEARAVELGHSFIVTVPERIRTWVLTNDPRYSDAARH